MDPALLLRKPFLLLVAGEVAVLATLGYGAWRFWQAGAAVAPPPASAAAAAASVPTPSSPGAVSGGPAPVVPAAPHPKATPGYRTDPLFFGNQTWNINREEAALEHAEWEIAHAMMTGAKSYINRVILPAVHKAQHPGGS
jgi:hypothetical protein